mgnify:CR=1 FL=1
MSLRINNNIESMNAHRNLLMNDRALSKSLERLASGQKINRQPMIRQLWLFLNT